MQDRCARPTPSIFKFGLQRTAGPYSWVKLGIGCNGVPAWAVDEAVRRWHRGECGDEYNYSFAPAPGTLRTIALQELEPAMTTLRSLKLVLSAAPSFADAERLAAAPPGAIIVRPTGK
jgi:hypothetical protein